MSQAQVSAPIAEQELKQEDAAAEEVVPRMKSKEEALVDEVGDVFEALYC